MTRAWARAASILAAASALLAVGDASDVSRDRAADGPAAGARPGPDRSQTTKAADARPAVAKPGADDLDIVVQASGLHWVAVIRIPFELGRAMDVEQANGEIFIVTQTGALTFYDRSSQTFEVIAKVDQHRNGLKRSTIARSKTFNMGYFRTFGLLVEPRDGNYRAYVGYHRFDDGCFYFEIATLTFALDDGAARIVADWRPLYTALPCIAPKTKGYVFAGHQAGGRIVALDRDHLLVSIGDHELDGMNGPAAPLDPTSPYGKIVLLDKETGESAIFAAGVRNPQGLLIAADGTIYETEHGPKGGDELNVIEQGRSFGWPSNTYGIWYGNNPWPLSPHQGRHDEGQRPLFAWLPSIAVSNLTQSRAPSSLCGRVT